MISPHKDTYVFTQLYVDSGTMDEKLKVNVKPLDKNHQTQKF